MQEEIITDINVDLKSDRLNDDVVLFMSCTLQELLVVIVASFFLGMAVGTVVMKPLTGSFVWGLPVGIIFFFVFFFILVYRFAKLKRDKPAGYYQQYLRIKLAKMGFLKSPYLVRTGKWSTERRVK